MYLCTAFFENNVQGTNTIMHGKTPECFYTVEGELLEKLSNTNYQSRITNGDRTVPRAERAVPAPLVNYIKTLEVFPILIFSV